MSATSNDVHDEDDEDDVHDDDGDEQEEQEEEEEEAPANGQIMSHCHWAALVVRPIRRALSWCCWPAGGWRADANEPERNAHKNQIECHNEHSIVSQRHFLASSCVCGRLSGAD